MVAPPVAVGVGEAVGEELDDRLDRVALHVLHPPRIRSGQERHDDRHVEVGRHLPHGGVLHPIGGVEHRRTGLERATGDLGPPRVDAHRHAERRERGNDRRQPVPLLLPVHHRGDVGRALPAHVDGVGAVGQELPGPGDRRGGTRGD